MGAKTVIGVEELKDSDSLWRSVVAEFLGCFALVAIGCGSCITWVPGHPPSFVHIALTFGFILATLVQSIGHVSGCHVNPAVTMGLLVSGKTTLVKAVVYIAAQCVGAIAGAAALKWVTPDSQAGTLGATLLNPLVLSWQGLLVEAFITWVLVLVVHAVTDENRPELSGGNAAPIAVGLAIATCHLFAVPITGSSMNPARALGPAVLQQLWEHHWIYWVGPILGGVVAGLMYKFILRAAKEDENSYNL